METTWLIQILCVVAFTVTATVTDLRTRKIPNWLTVSSAIVGLVFHICTKQLDGLLFSLGGFATGFGILLVLWLIGGGGGGDVKLMGAIGAWLGPKYTFAVFILSVFFAIVCMAIVIAVGLIRNFQSEKKPDNLLKKTLPYAIPCGLSTWSILLILTLTGKY